MIDKIRQKTPFISNNHTTRFIIHRNRGNHYPPDFVWGSRYKRNDAPDYYQLETGEKLPSMPYDYIVNDDEGVPTIKLIEADDGQYIAYKSEFDFDTEDAESLEDLEQVEIDTQYEEEAETVLKSSEEFNPVRFSVLDDRDERLTFFSDELKTKDEKYSGNSLASWIADNSQIVLIIGTAIAFAILYSQMGGAITDFMNYVQSGDFASDIAARSAQGAESGGAPPG